ncbi:cytochrome c biogenesis protein ResB [Cohnella pontilimi]|uniref:Cytochrome c biogenesis protein ResB n=1 Tax=Cohnella pontilimi TaxID=2564100 RepID=A0A4U0FHF6_9BACL|nr:cytochrome c biogenesis protein ResB [Cohnella pontilimi]TJY44381.1 cytochrome c biogenesis protein ResB [Cohnella pontilimi]
MISNTKCECGHQNHIGTVLCEACGKPLIELPDDGQMPAEMRYDGVARRSQKANPSWIDRIWNFFSSVKVAVWLIILTLIGASLGTIYPQEDTFINLDDPAAYYKQNYGNFGVIYHALGLSRTYQSWWFIGLLVMIGTSLVICSLDRVLPLYRALAKQQVRKHLQFLTRQQVVYAGAVPGDQNTWLDGFAKQLKKKRYRIWRDGDALLAEKNRFSRWGPYINHIGLIIFLLAVLGRGIPAWHMDQYISIDDGQTVPIPGTNFFVKNEKFTVEYYTDAELPPTLKGSVRPKMFNTKATLYQCTAACDDPTRDPVLERVKTHDIQVNHPLAYKGLKLYQYDFSEQLRLISVSPVIVNKKTGEQFGPFKLPMRNPALTYQVGPYTLELKDKFMDFGLDEQGRPMTKSRDPNAPAFVFLIKGPDLSAGGEPYIYFPKQNDKVKFGQDVLNRAVADKLDIRVNAMKDVSFSEYTTFLNVRVDKAMPFIWTGAAIFMIGVVIGFYWQHRRIWLRFDGGTLTLGAHTNKNNFGLRNEVAAALNRTGIDVPAKSLDNRRKTH